MKARRPAPLDVLVVAMPETAGSALYGMVDVLSAAGNLWNTLTRQPELTTCFRVHIVAHQREPFRCGNGIPVAPDHAVADEPAAPIVVVPELWLGPDEPMTGRHVAIVEWLRRRYRAGAHLYSACSGALLLAETGLLDGCPATSHWGYADLFRTCYPRIRFDPAPNLVLARSDGRIVTAGGTTSWHDLALHIIGRHASPGEALRIAKVYLMKWHAKDSCPSRRWSSTSRTATLSRAAANAGSRSTGGTSIPCDRSSAWRGFRHARWNGGSRPPPAARCSSTCSAYASSRPSVCSKKPHCRSTTSSSIAVMPRCRRSGVCSDDSPA
jgi:transcriptional regulator GlxA family with amidase domain